MKKIITPKILSLFLVVFYSLGFAKEKSSIINRPLIRTITAFIHIDRIRYIDQFTKTLSMLRTARNQFEKDGWEVQTLRITTQPFPKFIQGLSDDEALNFLIKLDLLFAQEKGVYLSIGPGMSQDNDNPGIMQLLGKFLAKAKVTSANALIATQAGIHWEVVKASAQLIKYLQKNSTGSEGNFNFTASAMLLPYSPFFPASYYNKGSGNKFSIGLQSANVVNEVFKRNPGAPMQASKDLKKELAFYAKLIEHSAHIVAQKTHWEYLGLDTTPVQNADFSIGAAIEHLTGRPFGSSGTLAAAHIITEAVKSLPVKQIGYSGLMLPVLEDRRIGQRWAQGLLGIDSLLAYSAVCGTGLDVIPLPGDISEDQIRLILGDIASLAYKWKKPLSGRLLPLEGKKPGDKTTFQNALLENTVLQKLP